MRLPRDISSKELIKLLKKFGYQITRQKGSHIRVTITQQGEHHITIPNHDPIRLGTLSSIISAVANHFTKNQRRNCCRNFLTGINPFDNYAIK